MVGFKRVSLQKCIELGKAVSLRAGFESFTVFYLVTGEPFKESAEWTREPIKMKD